MEPPVVVGAFLAVDSGRSPAAEAFLQAFRTDLPPIPESILRPGSGFRMIAPHVMVGPRPRSEEDWESLADRGVREALYLGPNPGAEDPAPPAASGIELRQVDARSLDVAADLAGGGPYFLYGLGFDRGVQKAVRTAFGPPLPPSPESTLRGRFESFLENGMPSYRSLVVWSPCET